MSKLPDLSALDLTALVASKVCHDIISPVGALVNGLEVLDEDQGEDMDAFAMELIRKSAKSASAKLKFCRLAFGASGSVGASIDTGDAEEVVRLYMEAEKPNVSWSGARSLVPKNRVKLLLNLVFVALNAVPRGGDIAITLHGEGEECTFDLRCSGPKARLPEDFIDTLSGNVEEEMTAHGVQPYYAVLLAQSCGLKLSAEMEEEDVVITASAA